MSSSSSQEMADRGGIGWPAARHASPCAKCADLAERVAWLESELGLQRDAEIFVRLRTFMGSRPSASSVGRSQASELVAALYAAHGRTLTRWQILDAVPSPSGRDDRDDKIIDVLVCHARRSLGKDSIENVWGKGYRLTAAGMTKVAAILGPQVEREDSREEP